MMYMYTDIFLYRELSRNDKNFQSLYHAFIVMIITGIAYSLIKDTVEAGK